jgi:20S proteasome subunit alpha 3
MSSTDHAGCVIGILAPGPSASSSSTDTKVGGFRAPLLCRLLTSICSQEDVTMEDTSTEVNKERQRAGIVIAAEKKVTSKLLDKQAGGTREKIFGINKYVVLFLVHLLRKRGSSEYSSLYTIAVSWS